MTTQQLLPPSLSRGLRDRIQMAGPLWTAQTSTPYHIGLVQCRSLEGELLTPKLMIIRQGVGVKVRFEEETEGYLEIHEG